MDIKSLHLKGGPESSATLHLATPAVGTPVPNATSVDSRFRGQKFNGIVEVKQR